MATATKSKPPKVTEETLTEFVESPGSKLRVDREAGIIYGVKLLGGQSRNGREYPPNVMREAVSLYEGAQVNLNHGSKPGQVRDLQDRMGVIRGATYQEGAGNFGNLHYNPKHPFADSLAWFAENSPGSISMSHVAVCKSRTQGGRVIIESIARVKSVDLVTEGATTNTLFESPSTEDEAVDLSKITLEEFVAARPDLKASILEEAKTGDELQAKDKTIKELREELDTFKAKQAADERRTEISEALKVANLDPSDKAAVSDVFMESLMGAKDAAARKALIDDRAAIFKAAPKLGQKPKSKDRTVVESAGNFANVTDGKTFAAALCR